MSLETGCQLSMFCLCTPVSGVSSNASLGISLSILSIREAGFLNLLLDLFSSYSPIFWRGFQTLLNSCRIWKNILCNYYKVNILGSKALFPPLGIWALLHIFFLLQVSSWKPWPTKALHGSFWDCSGSLSQDWGWYDDPWWALVPSHWCSSWWWPGLSRALGSRPTGHGETRNSTLAGMKNNKKGLFYINKIWQLFKFGLFLV